jgi:SH3-like domain-containing protein
MKKITILVLLLIFTAVSTARAERMAVSASRANIRSGPGTNYDILWKVEKFYPLIILTKKGNWYNFKDFEDDEGWLHKSLIGKMATVITIKKSANVRSGPGTKNGIIFTVESGVPFRVLKKEESWLQVEHADGDKGWIHKSLVW